MGNRQGGQGQPPPPNPPPNPNGQQQPQWQQPQPQWQQGQAPAAAPAQAQVNNHQVPQQGMGMGQHIPYNPRRTRYTTQQKDNAIRLLNMGMSYRQVARSIGPNCSSGTPHRWRRAHIAQLERRRRMQEMRRRRNW